MTDIKYIQSKLPETELLAQLAEEAAELAQAALKLRRVLDGTNPTPTTEEDCRKNLNEELADVLFVCAVANLPCITDEHFKIIYEKQARWAHRLREREEIYLNNKPT